MKLQKGEYLVSAFILALAVYPYSAQAGGLTVRIVTPPSQYSHAHRHHGPSATFSVGPVTSFSRTYGPVTSFGNTRFPNRGNRYYCRIHTVIRVTATTLPLLTGINNGLIICAAMNRDTGTVTAIPGGR